MDPVAVVMRQTTYTREEAEKALERTKTMEACIKEYLEVKEKEPKLVSVNQGIFQSIREFISTSSSDSEQVPGLNG
jgi:DNA polymerase/3'-5' exonuclease PolX